MLGLPAVPVTQTHNLLRFPATTMETTKLRRVIYIWNEYGLRTSKAKTCFLYDRTVVRHQCKYLHLNHRVRTFVDPAEKNFTLKVYQTKHICLIVLKHRRIMLLC